MKKIIFNSFLFSILSLSILIFPSCVDQDFDEPPADGGTVDLVANATVLQVKALLDGASFMQISDDLILEGIVTADDQSGNFYKKVIIEDATGGLEVLVNFTESYNDYPVGRQLFVKCQGLFLQEYAGTIQIGGSIYDDGGDPRLAGIEENLASEILFAGARNQTVPNTTLTSVIEAYDNSLLSRLVTIENVEFTSSEVGLTYADNVNLFSVNRNLVDCNGNSIIVRTSGYADFAGEVIPNGSGSLTGILSVFNGDYQLFIRDLNDVNLNDARCCEVNESFSTGLSGDMIELSGWRQYQAVGTEVWTYQSFGNEVVAKIQGFSANSNNIESWLITPSLDLSVPRKLRFESIIGYPSSGHTPLTVYVSQDYDGSNVEAATWTSLDANIASSADITSGNWSPNVPSGDVALPTGTSGYIAFVYTGNNSNQTSTIELDNIQICK